MGVILCETTEIAEQIGVYLARGTTTNIFNGLMIYCVLSFILVQLVYRPYIKSKTAII